MSKLKLLLEGGVAGHLAHLYDNPDLTFNEIKSILRAASSGQLVGTEKTDGYNIYLGAKQGVALYARNKGDMVAGGRTLQDLNMREFAGGQQVKDVYVKSFSAFQALVNNLDAAMQAAIFGPNGEIFYNTEIQGPGASNVVNYDANILSIHRSGHKLYDASTNKVLAIPKPSDVEYANFAKKFPNINIEQSSQYLDNSLDRFEERAQGMDFSVKRTAALQLKALSDDTAYENTIEKLNNAGFGGNMTVGDYIESQLRAVLLEDLSYFSPQTQQDIIDKIVSKDGAKNLRQIYKGYKPEEIEAIRALVSNGGKFISKAVSPLENAIHDFAVEMLRGLESAYILDNAAELGRLRREVRTAIDQISQYSGPGAEEAHEILKKQLKKLKSHNNINSVVEGFVFEYKGQNYKFTGNFAPINQLLGLFKYGRGTAPPIMTQDSQYLSEAVQHTNQQQAMAFTSAAGQMPRSIAVIPGGFKPPHRGHVAMAKHFNGLAEVVLVIMGHGAKTNKRTIAGQEVSFDVAKSLWSLMGDAVGLDAYIVEAPPGSNPMKIAYEILESAQPGQTIYMGAGAKDAERFRGQAEAYAPEGVNLEVEPFPDIKHSSQYMQLLEANPEIAQNMPSIKSAKKSPEELHASDLRYIAEQAMQNPVAVEMFKDFLPQGVDPAQVLQSLGVTVAQTQPEQAQDITETIFRLIEQEMAAEDIPNPVGDSLRARIEDAAIRATLGMPALAVKKAWDTGQMVGGALNRAVGGPSGDQYGFDDLVGNLGINLNPAGLVDDYIQSRMPAEQESSPPVGGLQTRRDWSSPSHAISLEENEIRDELADVGSEVIDDSSTAAMVGHGSGMVDDVANFGRRAKKVYDKVPKSAKQVVGKTLGGPASAVYGAFDTGLDAGSTINRLVGGGEGTASELFYNLAGDRTFTDVMNQVTDHLSQREDPYADTLARTHEHPDPQVQGLANLQRLAGGGEYSELWGRPGMNRQRNADLAATRSQLANYFDNNPIGGGDAVAQIDEQQQQGPPPPDWEGLMQGVAEATGAPIEQVMNTLGGMADEMGGAIEGGHEAFGAIENVLGALMDPEGPVGGPLQQITPSLEDIVKDFAGSYDKQAQKAQQAQSNDAYFAAKRQARLEEISAAGGGAVAGFAGGIGDDDDDEERQPTIFRENEADEIVEEVLNYLLQTTVS